MNVDKCKLYQVYNKIDIICDRLDRVLNISSNNVDYTDNGNTLCYIANLRESKYKYDNDNVIDTNHKHKKDSLLILNTIL